MIRSQMTMRAVVERNAASTADAYGGPVPPNWQAHATIACRAWSRDKKLVADGAKGALLQDLRAAFPIGADLTEADRIARIEDRRAQLLVQGPLSILTLQRRKGHLEAMLERVH